jgi:hypothetical protein
MTGHRCAAREAGSSSLFDAPKAIMLFAIAVVLAAGCSHSHSDGTVAGYFRLSGGSRAELLRGGLNFARTSEGLHGNGSGQTVRVRVNGSYTVTLPTGAYSVIGGLSGQPGRVPRERCSAAIIVMVRAHSTTHADYVCHALPVTTPT